MRITKQHLAKVGNAVNLPRHICNHLFGDCHTHGHRIFTGLLVAMLGVWIAHLNVVSPFHLVIDGFGYFLHGAGVYPIIEWLKPKA